MKLFRWFMGIGLCVFLLTVWGQNFTLSAEANPFNITQLSTTTEKGYLIIDTRYTWDFRKLTDLKVKFYVQLKDLAGKGDLTLAVGEKVIPEITKQSHEETGVIIPADLKIYGRPKKFRVEVWYKDKLRAAKTKPKISIEEQWWKAEETVNIIKTDLDIRKLIEDLKK